MHKCLHLVCPTDCLESIINNRFPHENYFYTSLGNSVVFDDCSLNQLKKIIKKYNITEVFFVLSDNNSIVFDALDSQEFSKVRGLKRFYKEITIQKKKAIKTALAGNLQFSIVSYYLNKKIKELELELKGLLNHPIKIYGKIYNRNKDLFLSIYPNLICLEKHHLN